MARLDMTAADTGSSTRIDEALFQRGIASSTGRDGEPDLIAAHKWFNLAATRGHREARLCRQEMAEMMSGEEILKAQKSAREWMKQAN